jgi:hypothetical protein
MPSGGSWYGSSNATYWFDLVFNIGTNLLFFTDFYGTNASLIVLKKKARVHLGTRASNGRLVA